MSIPKLFLDYSKTVFKSKMNYSIFQSPIGNMVVVADEIFVYLICFEDSENLPRHLQIVSEQLSCKYICAKNKVLQKFEQELESYFAGALTHFHTPIKRIGSVFQKEVWLKMQEIPYASTHTYGKLATEMGRETSHARAVGLACGANPLLLVIPCYRVVAANSNGGFSSGIHRKEWLLSHEQKNAS